MFLQRSGSTSTTRSSADELDANVRLGAGKPAALRTMDGRPRISLSRKAGSPGISDRDLGGAGYSQERCLPSCRAACRERRGARRFRERAAFFFESSIRTLTASPTRTLARPVIVLLSSGRLHDWFERHRGSLGPPRPPSAETFGAPTRFEPQKTRAIRRAKQLIALAALGGVLALIAVLRMWVL